MCLARVIFDEGPEGAEPIVIDVARIEPGENGLVVTGLMGETRTIRGTIKAIDFMKSTVVIDRKEG